MTEPPKAAGDRPSRGKLCSLTARVGLAKRFRRASGQGKVKLPRFRGVLMGLGDQGCAVASSGAAS